jgi:hypothetical protein
VAEGQGASLAEVLVALTLLAIGGGLSTRLLYQATLELEHAELGLRAAVLLSGLHDNASDGETGHRWTAGPGTLVAEESGSGWTVRYEPPPGSEGFARGTTSGVVGFRQTRTWSLDPP